MRHQQHAGALEGKMGVEAQQVDIVPAGTGDPVLHRCNLAAKRKGVEAEQAGMVQPKHGFAMEAEPWASGEYARLAPALPAIGVQPHQRLECRRDRVALRALYAEAAAAGGSIPGEAQ